MQKPTVESRLSLLQKLLATAEAEIGDEGGFGVGPLDLVVELDGPFEENISLTMLLDVDYLVDLVEVALQVDLLTVVDDLLIVYYIQILMLNCEHSQHIRPWEGLEVLHRQHVHHLPLNHLAPVQVMPGNLGEAK